MLSPDFNAAEAVRRVVAHMATKKLATCCCTRKCWPAWATSSSRRSALSPASTRSAKFPRSSPSRCRPPIAAAQKLVGANVLVDSGDTIVTMAADNAAPRTSPIPAPVCGSTDATANPAAAAANQFAAASKVRMRASPSGASAASPCPTARMYDDRNQEPNNV